MQAVIVFDLMFLKLLLLWVHLMCMS